MKISAKNSYIHCKELDIPESWITFGSHSGCDYVMSLTTEEKYLVSPSYRKITLHDGTLLVPEEAILAVVEEE